MVKKIVPGRTPDINALEQRTVAELGVAGLQTPDMDEIFWLDVSNTGWQTPDTNTVADH